VTTIFDDVRQLQQQAALDRKRGDALRKAGREPQARQAFDAGLEKLERCTAMLETARPDDPAQLAVVTAETFGSIAGLLRRLERNDDAFEAYVKGAAVERASDLATTYNRVNEIKYALLTSRATILQVEPLCRDTTTRLVATLSDPKTQQLGDDGWAWADLGDCRALLGELADATRAYSTFKDKAGVQAPAITLEVLQNIAKALNTQGDPHVERLNAAMSALRSLMGSGGPR
jgi:tetratricopeptide (TPR) repeat protein